MATPPRRPKASPKRISDLSLEDLYDKPTVTPSVRSAIIAKEDFSHVQANYCSKVCRVSPQDKDPRSVSWAYSRADVLVIMKHPPAPDKFKTSAQVHRTWIGVYSFLFNEINFKKWGYLYLSKCAPTTLAKRSQSQCSDCFPYLLEQIRAINPKVIVSESTEVTKALGLKKKSNSGNRGEVGFFELDGVQIPVVITLPISVTMMIRQNASGKFWGPDYLGVIRRDLYKACALATGQVTLKTLDEALEEIRRNKQIVVPKSLTEAEHWFNVLMALPANKVISWDLETTSLDPWAEDARILTCQFGYRREDGLVQAVVFPLWHRSQGIYDANLVWNSMMVPILTSERPKVGHNVKFDWIFTKVTTGVSPVNIAFDTLLVLHSLNSGIQGNYGLKVAVWDYLLGSGLGGYEDGLEEAMKLQRSQQGSEDIEEDDVYDTTDYF